jgi:hypothetical protein
MVYDEAITGVAPSMLHRQRVAAAAAVSTTQAGGDLDLTLAIADGFRRGRADPAYEAHMAPIGQWAMAVWERWLTPSALHKLVAVSRLKLTTAKPWCCIRGVDSQAGLDRERRLLRR